MEPNDDGMRDLDVPAHGLISELLAQARGTELLKRAQLAREIEEEAREALRGIIALDFYPHADDPRCEVCSALARAERVFSALGGRVVGKCQPREAAPVEVGPNEANELRAATCDEAVRIMAESDEWNADTTAALSELFVERGVAEIDEDGRFRVRR